MKRCASLCLERYRFYSKFGSFPPEGVKVNRIDAIVVGSDLGVSEYCSLYCQDPESGSRLKIGNRLRLNRNVMINADQGGNIEIGDDVLIGPNVVIRAANHRISDATKKIMDQGHEAGTIVIENNVWIGANVVILSNVRIGSGAVVAAGAAVATDVPANTIVGGVPAKEIKKRS